MGIVRIRDKRILITKEVVELLGPQVFLDCVAAGWLKPCAKKTGGLRDRSIFSLRDVETCEARLVEGEYPKKKGGKQ